MSYSPRGTAAAGDEHDRLSIDERERERVLGRHEVEDEHGPSELR